MCLLHGRGGAGAGVGLIRSCRSVHSTQCVFAACFPTRPLTAGCRQLDATLRADMNRERRRRASSTRATSEQQQEGEVGTEDADAGDSESAGSTGGGNVLSAVLRFLVRGEETVVLAEAAAVGLLTGTAVVLLNDGIHATHELTWGSFGLSGAAVDPGSRWPVVLLLPAAGGALVSFLRAAAGSFDAPPDAADAPLQVRVSHCTVSPSPASTHAISKTLASSHSRRPHSHAALLAPTRRSPAPSPRHAQLQSLSAAACRSGLRVRRFSSEVL